MNTKGYIISFDFPGWSSYNSIRNKLSKVLQKRNRAPMSSATFGLMFKQLLCARRRVNFEREERR